jgi:hypothetical protein
VRSGSWSGFRESSVSQPVLIIASGEVAKSEGSSGEKWPGVPCRPDDRGISIHDSLTEFCLLDDDPRYGDDVLGLGRELNTEWF